MDILKLIITMEILKLVVVVIWTWFGLGFIFSIFLLYKLDDLYNFGVGKPEGVDLGLVFACFLLFFRQFSIVNKEIKKSLDKLAGKDKKAIR